MIVMTAPSDLKTEVNERTNLSFVERLLMKSGVHGSCCHWAAVAEEIHVLNKGFLNVCQPRP
jgi:hypothetical protein